MNKNISIKLYQEVVKKLKHFKGVEIDFMKYEGVLYILIEPSNTSFVQMFDSLLDIAYKALGVWCNPDKTVYRLNLYTYDGDFLEAFERANLSRKLEELK